MPVALRVRTNALEVAGAFGVLYRDQLPFAIKEAINDTAKDAQRAQRAGMPQRFTIRRKAWVERGIKIKPFATKRRLVATIAVDPPGGESRADILTRHEERGFRVPFKGRALAVPIEARANKQDVVAKRNRPKAFAFREMVRGTGGTRVFKGQKRTFMIQRPDGTGWILKRTGRGKHGSLFEGTSVLYVLDKSVPIESRLQFVNTVTDTVQVTFKGHFSRSFDRAVRTAR